VYFGDFNRDRSWEPTCSDLGIVSWEAGKFELLKCVDLNGLVLTSKVTPFEQVTEGPEERV
jgi:hypothetical protein